ncbi:hypothetical protein R6Q59_003113 [Mikania micrantha]
MVSRSLHWSTNLKSLCLYECQLMFDLSLVGDLENLEVLSFARCHIRKLPSAIGKLVNLRLLDLTGCWDLRIDNGVFENLKNLEELHMDLGDGRPIRKKNELTDSNIKELAMLSKQFRALYLEFDLFEKKNQLENFSFEKLDNFKIFIGYLFYLIEIENSSFVNKLKLTSDHSSDIHDFKISELFKKTEQLYLCVIDMIDRKDILILPFDQHSFSCLKDLEILLCSNLKHLFPVCVANGLKKLERLKITVCPVMEALIQNEGSEINGVVGLPQLHQLYLYDLPNFTSIYPYNNSSLCALFNSQVKFAKLEKLRIRKMEKLKQIWGCEFGSSQEEEVNNISTLREIELLDKKFKKPFCKEKKIRVFHVHSSNLYFHSLHHLSLSKCEGVEVVFEIDLNNQQPPLPNLQSLKLGEMDNMSQVWMCNNWNKYLLISYSSFHNLTSIEIYKCNMIKYLFSPLMAKTLSNLHKIKVDECRDMEEVVSNRDDDDDKNEEEMTTTSTSTTFFPHLHSLTFVKLKNLKRIGGG